MNRKNLIFAGALGSVALILGAASNAGAAFVPGQALVDPGLSGTTQSDVWTNLSMFGTGIAGEAWPGFPGTGDWLHPIESQSGDDAALSKIANGTGGGPYPGSASIYFGGFSGDTNNLGGTLAVGDSTPVADLANVVFQVQIGEAWTYDFYNHELPVLSYNGGGQNLQATTSLILEKFDNGTVTMPTGEETVYINTYEIQWDLTGITDPITDFSISFSGVQHSQLYGLRLDQSDSYSAVPEPASAGLLLISTIGLLQRRRRRA